MSETEQKPILAQVAPPQQRTLNPTVTAGFGAATPSTGVTYGQSLFSVMHSAGGALQGVASMRTTILTDLFTRLKDKTMYLQNITLGDEQISASLSRLYQGTSLKFNYFMCDASISTSVSH